MKTGEVAERIGIGGGSLRLWTTQDFKEYFSPSVQGDGSRRNWGEQDIRIAALIAEMRRQSKSTDDIHATLKSLRSGGWNGLPDVPELPRTPAQMEREVEIRMDSAVKQYQGQIAMLSADIQVLREELATKADELNEERRQNKQLREKHSQEISDLRDAHDEEKSKLMGEIGEIREKLGRAEGVLEYLLSKEKGE